MRGRRWGKIGVSGVKKGCFFKSPLGKVNYRKTFKNRGYFYPKYPNFTPTF
tara:strand:- start:1639 stop:1791 length:153 start_codon:yes stop_codon:yes gene_type:complete